MNVLKLIGGVVALMALLALVGCVQVFGPEENGEDAVEPSSAVWLMDQTGESGQIVSTDEPDPKFSHQGAAFENNGDMAIAVTYDPLTLTIAGSSEDTTITSVSVDIIYQVDGHEREQTGIAVGHAGGVFFDSSATFPDGLDFWDDDGDGEFLASTPSGDYPVLAFKEITIDGSVVWTNPDL